jgi:hypothetical protein
MSFDLDSGSLQFPKNSFGLLEERLTGRRELDMTPRSYQERGSQFVLEIFDALA